MLDDIILTGLVSEITAESLAELSSGSTITALSPSRGEYTYPLDVRAGEEPTYVLDGTTPTINFPAGKRAVWSTTAWPHTIQTAEGLTVFTVSKINTLGTGGSLFPVATSSGVRTRVSPAGVLDLNRVGGASYTTIDAAPGTAWRVDGYRLAADGSVSVAANTATIASVASLAGTDAMVNLGLGLSDSAATGWDWSARHVLVYRGALTNQQITDTVRFLADKWGVTLD